MKKTLILFTLLINTKSLWGIDCKNLEERENITYRKFTEKRFTGKVSGFCTDIYAGIYKNGKCEGRCRRYYNNEGILQDDYFFKDGKWEGVQKWYFINGNLWKEINYKNGKRDGLYEYRNFDGYIIERTVWKSDKCIRAIVGECLSY